MISVHAVDFGCYSHKLANFMGEFICCVKLFLP